MCHNDPADLEHDKEFQDSYWNQSVNFGWLIRRWGRWKVYEWQSGQSAVRRRYIGQSRLQAEKQSG